MVGDNLTQMSLTGQVLKGQHLPTIQVQITITLVGQVRKSASSSFDVCLFVSRLFACLIELLCFKCIFIQVHINRKMSRKRTNSFLFTKCLIVHTQQN